MSLRFMFKCSSLLFMRYFLIRLQTHFEVEDLIINTNPRFQLRFFCYSQRLLQKPGHLARQQSMEVRCSNWGTWWLLLFCVEGNCVLISMRSWWVWIGLSLAALSFTWGSLTLLLNSFLCSPRYSLENYSPNWRMPNASKLGSLPGGKNC